MKKTILFRYQWCDYLHDDKLEIGIETVEKYRGMGFARAACMALIDYCIENGLEPVWSCRLENTPSTNLAKSLGFFETMRLPYYHIPV
ncbi:MAG: GNAT family N-acetyltransferase [Synergistaceae bacterium]|nr:GNAT family N-acetyltransferase [Synergistaceae bacterium]